MKFSVLGPLRAETGDGTTLPLRRPSQRATLAVLLLLAATQPASKTLLIEALWGESPPRDASTALRVRMRDLRCALAGGRDRVATDDAGYRVVIQPGELDTDTFATLARLGRAALDSGNADHAARLLDQACRLWREPVLADVPDTPPMRAATAALLGLRRDVREWLTDARLALGQHHELVSEIRAGIAADPMTEHRHVQLMLALYRCGQKTAALAAYTRLSELTTREFGQDPGPEARELLQAILRDAPALRYRARHMPEAGGNGRESWVPLRQLPPAAPDFTGRVAQIEMLARGMSVGGMQVTVITGPPGIGKTTLALHAAHLASETFRDGQLYLHFGGRTGRRSPEDALGELLRSLGVPAASVPSALAERSALYRSLLAGRRVLLLADDVTAPAQIRPLLPGSAGCAVLVTSRSLLPDLESARAMQLGPVCQEEALAFLGKIVGDGRLAAESAAAAAVVAACGGLPLALRVAGARLAATPALKLADLAAALASPGAVVTELVIGDLSVPDRLAQAWSALDPQARQVLWSLARTRPGAVTGSVLGGIPASAQAGVRMLSDDNLLLHDAVAGCYRLAPLIADYALAQPAPDRDGAVPGAADASSAPG